MTRLAVVIDDYALAALPGLDVQLAAAGAIVMRSFAALPNPNHLRRFPDCRGAAVLGGKDRCGLVARLETATATLAAPVIAVLPRGVDAAGELRGPGVVDLIPAGVRGAAERIALMAHVPIVTPAARRLTSTRIDDGARPVPPVVEPSCPAQRPADSGRAPGTPDRVIGVASSTGGVWILAGLLRELSGDGGEAVLVAQHMEAEFVPFFSEWLSTISGWRTFVVDERVAISPGAAYVPLGGRDLVVEGATVSSLPASSRYVPSADRLLRSLAESLGAVATGVVLSGMGTDGSQGLAEIVRNGGRAICQLPSTAVVPSMPEAALRLALGAIAAPPEALARALRGAAA